MRPIRLLVLAVVATGIALGSLPVAATATASVPAPQAETPAPAELAQRYGADERGMRRYVLVVLKTGPTRMPDGEARTAMFAGHMANIQRLAKEGKLSVAGPFMPSDSGWRGLFIFAVESVEEAKALTETDPVIVNGAMVAEYHPWYGSAALMATAELHERMVPPEAAKAD